MEDMIFLDVIIFSLLGIFVSGVLSVFCNCKRMMLQTLLFFSCFFISLDNKRIIIFLLSGMIFLLLASVDDFPNLISLLKNHNVRGFTIIFALTLVGIFYFRSDLFKFIIGTGSVGRFFLVLVVTIVLILKTRAGMMKTYLSLIAGFALALIGTDPFTGQFRLIGSILEWANGIPLVVVLSGLCVFSPIMLKVGDEEREASLGGWTVAGELLALFGLVFLGFGTSLFSIIAFGILEQLHLPFGALPSLEDRGSVYKLLAGMCFSIVLSSAAIVLVRKNKKIVSRYKNHWIRDSVFPILSFTAIYLAGLGLWSMLLAVGFGFLGLFMKHHGIPSSILIVGFIYGDQLERLGRLSLFANYRIQFIQLCLIATGIITLLVLYKILQPILKYRE